MHFGRRAILSVMAAAAFAGTWAGGTAVAAAAPPQQATGGGISVECAEPDDNGVAACGVLSSHSFSGDEQLEFSATMHDGSTVTGTTGTPGISGLRPVWCVVPSSPGTRCYIFEITNSDTSGGQPQTPGTTESTIVTPSDGTPQGSQQANLPGAAPCPHQPTLTCISQPQGDNVVTIRVEDQGDGTGATVTVEKDGETSENDAAGYHRTQDDISTTQQWQDDVDETTDDDDIAVIWAADGTQTEEEQLNRQRLENEIYARGEPYVVCFEDVTYTKTNADGTTEQVTVPGGDCIVVTP